MKSKLARKSVALFETLENRQLMSASGSSTFVKFIPVDPTTINVPVDSTGGSSGSADVLPVTSIYNAPGDTALPAGYVDSASFDPANNPDFNSPATVVAIASSKQIPTADFLAANTDNTYFADNADQLGQSVLQVNYTDGTIGYFTAALSSADAQPQSLTLDTSASTSAAPDYFATNSDYWTAKYKVNVYNPVGQENQLPTDDAYAIPTAIKITSTETIQTSDFLASNAGSVYGPDQMDASSLTPTLEKDTYADGTIAYFSTDATPAGVLLIQTSDSLASGVSAVSVAGYIPYQVAAADGTITSDPIRFENFGGISGDIFSADASTNTSMTTDAAPPAVETPAVETPVIDTSVQAPVTTETATAAPVLAAAVVELNSTDYVVKDVSDLKLAYPEVSASQGGIKGAIKGAIKSAIESPKAPAQTIAAKPLDATTDKPASTDLTDKKQKLVDQLNETKTDVVDQLGA